jgi:hypothetical protein
LHPLLVVGEQALGQVERLLLGLEVVDLVGQIPVGVPDVSRRRRNRRLQLHVGGVAILARRFKLLAVGVDLEVAQERLHQAHIEPRVEQRVPVVEEVRRRRAETAEVDRVIGAGAQDLIEAHLPGGPCVGDLGLAAGEGAGRWRVLGEVGYAGGGVWGPERLRLRDGDVLNLRVDPIGPNAEVLLERESDRFVHRQAPYGGRTW